MSKSLKKSVPNLKVKKLSPESKLPQRAYNSPAGIDLFAAKRVRIPSHNKAVVPTGLAFEIPEGYFMKIWDKSGVATKAEITISVRAGVIDSDYRGEVGIVIANTGEMPVLIEAGMKLAQGVMMEKLEYEIEEVTELSETVRGDKGFGSSDEQTK